MIQTIEIFYSFQCPYSYLAIDRLSQFEQKFDVKVLWQPYSAKAAGKNFQNAPVSPERASYIKEDVIRLAKKMDMPLTLREDWPEKEPDPDKSIRGALIAGDMEIAVEYNIKMFHRWWGEGEDPNDQAFFIQLCDELDLDPNEFAGRISTHDVRERVRGLYKRGRKLQVFDTPMVLIGEDRFNGLDRLHDIEERLEKLGTRKPNWV